MRHYRITIEYIETGSPTIKDVVSVSEDSLLLSGKNTQLMQEVFNRQWRRFLDYKRFIQNLKNQKDESDNKHGGNTDEKR